MKDISELNPHKFPTNPNIDKNLGILFQRLSEIQSAYRKDFLITSGLRSELFQAELISQGKSNAKFSKHCAGAAADVLDDSGDLAQYCKLNLTLLQKIGLWCEDFDHTKGWCHFQILSPMSGKRIFIP